jgi:hypothetical protein
MNGLPQQNGHRPLKLKSKPDELIVAIPDTAAVKHALSAIGLTGTVKKTSAALGLRLLSFERNGGGQPPGSESPDLDDTLRGVREYFGAKPGKWIPTIGKNRLIGRILGAGEVSFGGEGEPEPVTPDPEWPARHAAPGRDVNIGVIDSGILDSGIVQQPGKWLSGGWRAQYSDVEVFAPRRKQPRALACHSVFLTGLLLSQAPGATVQVRRALNPRGATDSWEVANAIVEFGNSGLDVLNLSFACYTADGQPPLALATAIDRLHPDVVVVAAAGNHGILPENQTQPHPETASPAWPAALNDVVAVGAANRYGEKADFSPNPEDAPWIDLHAVGVNNVSTFFTGKVELRSGPNGPHNESFNGYAQWSGTSFAAALVSGAIAAGTQPGRVSARASYENIRSALGNQTAPFLHLNLL